MRIEHLERGVVNNTSPLERMNWDLDLRPELGTELAEEVLATRMGKMTAYGGNDVDLLDLVDKFARNLPVGADDRLVDRGEVFARMRRSGLNELAGKVTTDRECTAIWER